MELGEFLKMQHTLAVEKGWMKDRDPEHGAFSLLWSIDELGEAISIIKKKGADGIMHNPAVRERFVEEIADHLMYVFDMMECFGITAEECTEVYVKKFERNLGRSWTENEMMYENAPVRRVVLSDNALPDERLWELLLRAGVKVTVVTKDPARVKILLESLVSDPEKVTVTTREPDDPAPDDPLPDALRVTDEKSLAALKEAFGEEE